MITVIRLVAFIITIKSLSGFSSTYSMNLMWLNQSLAKEQEFLCKDFANNCLDSIKGWVNKSEPEATIYFWYDSTYVTRKALENTVHVVNDALGALSKPRATLEFKDVRELPLVKQHEEVFSEKLPVYFRADLLRVIIGDYLARIKKTKFVGYADLNIPPLTKEALFDQTTMNTLEKYGQVVAKNMQPSVHMIDFENAFFILKTDDEAMIQANRLALIDVNIARAEHVLAHGYTTKQEYEKTKEGLLCESKFPELLFMVYKDAFKLYAYFNMRAEINNSVVSQTKILNITKKQFCNIASEEKQIGQRFRPSNNLCTKYFGDSSEDSSHYFEILKFIAPPPNRSGYELRPYAGNAQATQGNTSPVESTKERLAQFSDFNKLFNITSQDWKVNMRYFKAVYVSDFYKRSNIDDEWMVDLTKTFSEPSPIKDVNKPPSSHYDKPKIVNPGGC